MKRNLQIALTVVVISGLLSLSAFLLFQSNQNKQTITALQNQVTQQDENITETNPVKPEIKEEIVPPQPKTMVYQKGNQVRVEIGENKTLFEICKDNIVRINYLNNGYESEDTAVIGRTSFEPVEYKLTKEGNPIQIQTDEMLIEYFPTEYKLNVKNKQGILLFTQNTQDPLSHQQVSFNHDENIPLYGINGYDAWEKSDDLMLRQSGGSVEAGQQGDCGAPYVWTTKGFGILIDTDGGQFKNSATELSYSGNSKTDLEYYIFTGNPNEIQEALFTISGTAPMFPKWAVGFTNSEWGMDQDELLEIIQTYREKQLPLDNYTLDFDWKAWGEDNYGEFRWNNEKFPDGASGKLKDLLLQQGVKMTGIFKPRILTNTIQGAYAQQNGYFWKNQEPYPEYFSKELANDIDFANAQAGAWYFEHTKDAIETGIVGFWNDEADERFDNMQHMNMQKTLFLGQRGYNDQRVWSINRNFYLGAQKYAYGMWSGDIDTGFPSMKMQRERMLSAINLGEVKWGMDTGGFNGGNPSPENYGRWIQFSAFTPIFRVHSTQDMQRQPWVFGQAAEDAARVAMELRYELIPYIYSYDRRAYETGRGLVKPLMYDYPDDPQLENYVDAWMFGDFLLVAPIVDKQQVTKTIYLPQGNWINYWTGEMIQGGKEIQWTCDTKNFKDVPLFIKQGAIIPMQEKMLYVDEKVVKSLDVIMYPDTNQSEMNIYDDDGQSYDYESGIYFKKNIQMIQKENKVEIQLSASVGSYATRIQDLKLKIYGNFNNAQFNEKEVKATTLVDQRGSYLEIIVPIDGIGTLIIE